VEILMRRRAASVVFRLLLLASWGAASIAPISVLAQSNTVELAIKATYLYKFPPFVEWPASALPPGGYFAICIVGDDPFGAMLDQAVTGQQIKDRPILVRRMVIFNADAGCQIVYATGSAMQPVPVILAALRGRPVLSVTDSDREGQPRGILNFMIAENRIRFEIDDAAAAESGLVISSKLLSLAIRVRPRS
jgi:YfiR/HmsC-like